MLKMLELLDREAPSGNPIFLFDVGTEKLLGGNEVANELFATKYNEFNLEKIFGSSLPLESLVKTVTLRLDSSETTSIQNVDAVTKNNENRFCNAEFTFLTTQRKGILMTVKFKKDFRDFLIKALLAKKNRPAFLMDYEEELHIRRVNDIFYNDFSCTEDNISDSLGNKLENFIREENRVDSAMEVLHEISENTSGMLRLPFKTDSGEDLQFYFSKKIIKPLLAENDKCVYCLIAKLEETMEDVEYPFDKRVEKTLPKYKESSEQFSCLLGQFVAIGFLLEERTMGNRVTKDLYTTLNLEKFFLSLDVSLTEYHKNMTKVRQDVLDTGKVALVDKFDNMYTALSVENYSAMTIKKDCFQEGFNYEKQASAKLDL